MLGHFGATVRVEPHREAARRITVVGQPELNAAPIAVPADLSSAAFPLVAGLIVPGSEVTVDEVGLNPSRTGLLACLEEMGADIAYLNERVEGGEPVADLRVRAGTLAGADIPPERAPSMIDEYPILAVAAAVRQGPHGHARPCRAAGQGKRPADRHRRRASPPAASRCRSRATI